MTMAAEGEAPERGLASLLATLRRRWRWFAAPVVLLPVLALVYTSTRPDVYSATAEVQLDTSAARSSAAANPTQVDDADDLADRFVVDEARTANGATVRALAAERLGASDLADLDGGSVTGDLDADTLVVRFTAASAQRASDGANAWAEAYVDAERTSAQTLLDDTIAQQEEELSQLERRRTGLRQPIAELEEQLAAEQGAGARAALRRQIEEEEGAIADDLALIDTQVAAASEEIEALRSARDRAGIAQVVRAAEPPSEPANRQLLRNLVVGLVLGVLLGVGLALLMARIRNGEQKATALEQLGLRLGLGLGSLGRIPSIPRRTADRRSGTIAKTQPTGIHATAYHGVRTSLQFLLLDRDVKTVMVTSPVDGDGKSTTTSNLALAYAEANYDVLVVDADLRHPTLHESLPAPRSPGLSELTAEHSSLAEFVIDVTALSPRLRFVPAGAQPPTDPAAHLASPPVISGLAALRGRADIVLIDGPAVLPGGDALALAPEVDAIIVVLDVTTVTEDRVVETVANLRVAGGNVIGTVLNRAEISTNAARRSARLDSPVARSASPSPAAAAPNAPTVPETQVARPATSPPVPDPPPAHAAAAHPAAAPVESSDDAENDELIATIDMPKDLLNELRDTVGGVANGPAHSAAGNGTNHRLAPPPPNGTNPELAPSPNDSNPNPAPPPPNDSNPEPAPPPPNDSNAKPAPPPPSGSNGEAGPGDAATATVSHAVAAKTDEAATSDRPSSDQPSSDRPSSDRPSSDTAAPAEVDDDLLLLLDDLHDEDG